MLSLFTDMKQTPNTLLSHWLIQSLQQLGNPFVLILDNSDDLLESGNVNLKGDVLRFIEDILAQCNFIKLLITSRESLDYLSHKIPIHLERIGVLNEVASDDLVKSLLPDVSEPDRNSVVKACGQVPLAMRLMCRTVTEQHVSVSELLEELKLSPLVQVLDNDSFYGDVRLNTIISTSFQRLTANEKDSFVSLAVFPGCFGIDQAMSVLNLDTVTQTKKVIRSLERKSLIDCSKNFASFTIHSLLRSFIDEKRTTHQETEAVFLTAQRRFYDYHISSFEAANGMFLTGHSNKALVAFLDRRESIILSLSNGTRDDELYGKAVDVLSKAELFLYAVLPNEELLFKTIYDIAMSEAHKRQNIDDKRKLLAAKSFCHWGWFSSDPQTWDHSLQEGFADAAHFPAKLLCYFGIHKILCCKLEEGISSLRGSVDFLGSSCDETVLKLLVYIILAISYWKKQEHKMASCFMDLFKVEANAGSAWVALMIPTKEELPSKEDDLFLFSVTSGLIFLALKKKAIDLHAVRTMPAFLEKFLEFCQPFGPEGKFFENVLRQQVALMQSELEDPELLTPKSAVALRSLLSFFHQNPRNHLNITSLNQLSEKFLHCLEVEPSARGLCQLCGYWLAGGLKELLQYVGNCIESRADKRRVDFKGFASTHDTLGKVLHFTEDYSGALESHQQAIRVREENIGDHVDSALSLTNMGCTYFKMNNESEAIKSFQSALELRKQLGVYDHVDTANIYFTLAENHFTLRNYEEAIQAHLKALELRQKHLGKNPITGESLHHLAVVYYMMAETEINNLIRRHNSCKFSLVFCKQALSMRCELLGEHVDTANSFQLLGLVYYKMREFSSAVKTFQKASDMRSHLLGNHGDTALSYHWLGLAQCDMGNLNKALKSLQNALQLRKKCSMGDDPGIGDTINAIGHVYYTMGDYQSAREQFHGAVNLYKSLVDKHESTALSCQNLALTYLAMETYPEALEFCQQALTMKLELLGEHVETAISFHLLGKVHCKLREFSSAVDAFQRASVMRSNLLGDHKDTAESYHYLGLAQCEMGDFKKALESLHRVLQLRKKCLIGDHYLALGSFPEALEFSQKAGTMRLELSRDHVDTANSLNKCGRLTYKISDYISARKQFQAAVDVYNRLPNKQKCTANSYYNLALTYLAMKSYPEALKCCQKALTMRRELLGEHVKTANGLHALGRIHYKMGDFSSAVEAFQKASVMRSKLLGFTKDTALSYHRLGKAQSGRGDRNGALKSLQTASRLRKAILGNRPSTANSFHKCGRLSYNTGDYYSASQQFQNALDVYKRLPDKQKCTATSYHNLALTYLAMESYPEALECCQEALSMRRELLGEHEKTANGFYTSGRIYYKMGDFSSAVEAFQKASDMRSNLLGDSKDTALSYHRLGKAQFDMGDLNGALESFNIASRMRKEVLGDHPDTAKSLNLRDYVSDALNSTATGWKCSII